MSFARLAFHDAKPGALSGTCALCGATVTDGHPTAISDNFVEVDLLASPRSAVTCSPCTAALGNSPHVSPRASARPLGWRMFSLFARDGLPLEHASKAEKPRIRGWVLGAPYPERWGIHIADSGKKQRAPFAPVNAPSGRCALQLETVRVEYEPAALRVHLDVVERLYAIGVSKAELETGTVSVGRLRKLSAPEIRAARPLLHAVRCQSYTPIHALAVWLAQRENEDGDDDGDE
jgi:hypothetical protein